MIAARKPNAGALRKDRVSESGRIYHVVTTTLERKHYFADFARARQAILTLKKSDALQRTQTLAFTLMPDHLHWLFELDEGATLSQTVASFKAFSARALGEPIWQKGFFDHALRAEDDVQSIARYIVANPVRAGLVESVATYPHWDAIWL